MKKSFILSLIMGVIAACSFGANAQEKKFDGKRQFNPEQMIQHRAQSMAEKMQLDDATTAKFIETYKAYLKETHEVYKQHGNKNGFKKRDQGAQARKTDAEVEKEILDQFALSRSLVDVREKYYKKFRAFLNPHQIQKIYSQERENANRMKWEKDRRGKGPKDHKGPRADMHGKKDKPGKPAQETM